MPTTEEVAAALALSEGNTTEAADRLRCSRAAVRYHRDKPEFVPQFRTALGLVREEIGNLLADVLLEGARRYTPERLRKLTDRDWNRLMGTLADKLARLTEVGTRLPEPAPTRMAVIVNVPGPDARTAIGPRFHGPPLRDEDLTDPNAVQVLRPPGFGQPHHDGVRALGPMSTADKREYARRRRAEGATQVRIAGELGVTQGRVSQLLAGDG